MKSWKALIMAALMSCSATVQAAECNADISTFFKDAKGCFILYNMKSKTNEITYGGAACDRALAPASSFKVPNSIIALDTGVVADENTLYKWDGSKQFLPEHERDHTLASAMKYSVVWYFKKIAEQVGEERYKEYLKKLDYGNQDISSGLTNFWLGKSLKITPKEQLAFLDTLYRGTLPVSKRSMDITKKIMVLESNGDAVLSGKTGTASADGENIGWFIGHLQSAGDEYLFVTNITQVGTDYKIQGDYAGPTAKKIGKEILACSKNIQF